MSNALYTDTDVLPQDIGRIVPRHVSQTLDRTFATGAKRDTEEGKLRFHATLSPYALEAWTDYCRRHNSQVHRREENWKKGMPLDSFLGSMFRHFHHVWKLHDFTAGIGELDSQTHRELVDALCGVLFNAHGYLHEITKPLDKQRMLGEHLATTGDQAHEQHSDGS